MYKERIQRLRRAIKEKDLDAVLLQSDPNRNYLSGFTGDESFSIITEKEAIFITDSRFTEQARQQVKDYEIIQYKGAFQDFLGSMTKKLSVKKLGFEEDIVSFSTYNTYKNTVSCELVPMGGIVEKLRLIKDDYEIKCMRDAAKIADKAFLHMIEFIKPGMTERQIGLELEFTLKKLGAKDLSFPSIIASGERSCLPHGQATNKIVNNGEFLTMDFGCIYENYCSDMTRTVVIGEPSSEMVKVYNTVLAAQENALKAYKAGVTGAEVDKVARDFIEKAGYGDKFGHGLGHGVGRQIHEMPRISPLGTTKLEAGMVVTDEPGIYISGFGGVRIEDLLVVTDNGCEVLSKSPKDLICI